MKKRFILLLLLTGCAQMAQDAQDAAKKDPNAIKNKPYTGCEGWDKFSDKVDKFFGTTYDKDGNPVSRETRKDQEMAEAVYQAKKARAEAEMEEKIRMEERIREKIRAEKARK